MRVGLYRIGSGSYWIGIRKIEGCQIWRNTTRHECDSSAPRFLDPFVPFVYVKASLTEAQTAIISHHGGSSGFRGSNFTFQNWPTAEASVASSFYAGVFPWYADPNARKQGNESCSVTDDVRGQPPQRQEQNLIDPQNQSEKRSNTFTPPPACFANAVEVTATKPSQA